jgi:hypothetical protein
MRKDPDMGRGLAGDHRDVSYSLALTMARALQWAVHYLNEYWYQS